MAEENKRAGAGRTGEDALLQKPGLLGPALTFAVMFVPMLLALYVGLSSGPEPVVAVPVKPVVEAAIKPITPGSTGNRSANGGSRGGLTENKACGFTELLGLTPGDTVLARIKAAGKTYRLLPPGSMMTMDFSASRINLELDDQGVIQRVWCG